MSNANLEMWQARLERNESAYESKLADMDRREKAYKGDRELTARVVGDRPGKFLHPPAKGDGQTEEGREESQDH